MCKALAEDRFKAGHVGAESCPEKQFFIGTCYELRSGVAKSPALAFDWYMRAAERHHSRAQHNVGVAFELGDGVLADMDRAVKWFHLAANNGNTFSQRNLGLYYLNGSGVAADIVLAVAYLRAAADGGDNVAQCHLGNILMLGRGGTPVDLAEASLRLLQSATAGNQVAQYLLGCSFDKGLCGVVDPAVAASWYERAAESGHAESMYHLGLLHEKGRGITQNVVTAVSPRSRGWQRWCAVQPGNVSLARHRRPH